MIEVKTNVFRSRETISSFSLKTPKLYDNLFSYVNNNQQYSPENGDIKNQLLFDRPV